MTARAVDRRNMTATYRKENLLFTLKRVGLRASVLAGAWLAFWSFIWVIFLAHPAQWAQLAYGVGAIALAMAAEVARVHIFRRKPQARLADFFSKR